MAIKQAEEFEVNFVQNIKRSLAAFLTSKGQSSVGTETLTALVNKVASIATTPSAGDFLYTSKPTGSVRNTSMVKLGGDTTINYTGVARIRFKFRTGGVGTSFARVYKNGVPYGTQRSTSNTTDVTFTEDLSFNAGDVIALWGASPSSTDWIYGGNLDVLGSIGPWAT